MKRPALKYYRKAAVRCVQLYDARHPAYAGIKQTVSNTRTPNGAWVELWVWVPTEAAQLERK